MTRAVEARRPEALDPLPDKRLPLEVQPLVRALNGLLARLAAALDTQKAFVADAAHELRTPLAAVQIQAQLVARAKDDASRREAIADLQDGVSRATRLTEQLLALARAEPDGATMREPVDLQALLAECVAALAPLAQRHDIDLGFEETRAASVVADVGALRVMFGNLLDNAVKYTPDGGRIATRDAAGRACVQIGDSRPGIPADERERVFDRFYRDSSRGRAPTCRAAAEPRSSSAWPRSRARRCRSATRPRAACSSASCSAMPRCRPRRRSRPNPCEACPRGRGGRLSPLKAD